MIDTCVAGNSGPLHLPCQLVLEEHRLVSCRREGDGPQYPALSPLSEVVLHHLTGHLGLNTDRIAGGQGLLLLANILQSADGLTQNWVGAS